MLPDKRSREWNKGGSFPSKEAPGARAEAKIPSPETPASFEQPGTTFEEAIPGLPTAARVEAPAAQSAAELAGLAKDINQISAEVEASLRIPSREFNKPAVASSLESRIENFFKADMQG